MQLESQINHLLFSNRSHYTLREFCRLALNWKSGKGKAVALKYYERFVNLPITDSVISRIWPTWKLEIRLSFNPTTLLFEDVLKANELKWELFFWAVFILKFVSRQLPWMQLDPGNYLWISDANKINAYKLNASCNIYDRPHVTLKCDVHDVNRFIFKRNTLVAGYRLMLHLPTSSLYFHNELPSQRAFCYFVFC